MSDRVVAGLFRRRSAPVKRKTAALRAYRVPIGRVERSLPRPRLASGSRAASPGRVGFALEVRGDHAPAVDRRLLVAERGEAVALGHADVLEIARRQRGEPAALRRRRRRVRSSVVRICLPIADRPQGRRPDRARPRRRHTMPCFTCLNLAFTQSVADLDIWRMDRAQSQCLFRQRIGCYTMGPLDRLPPLTALRAFEAVARKLSFARAAEDLHVTKAAVAQQVRALEQEIGAPLVDAVRPGPRADRGRGGRRGRPWPRASPSSPAPRARCARRRGGGSW